jgi:hypothetical protein
MWRGVEVGSVTRASSHLARRLHSCNPGLRYEVPQFQKVRSYLLDDFEMVPSRIDALSGLEGEAEDGICRG